MIFLQLFKCSLV